MCIGLLKKQDFYENYVFWKTGLKKLANSQPGAKFSVFPKSCRFVPRVRNGYWGSSSQSFTQ